MNLCLLRISRKDKAKAEDLFSSAGYMQKLKKSIDFLKKSYILKIGSRSARFKKLAETQNICIVYENEPSIKKLIARTNISA